MQKRIFTLTIFFAVLLIPQLAFAFGDSSRPSVPASTATTEYIDQAECPAACPCCDALSDGLLNSLYTYNDIIKGLNEAAEGLTEEGDLKDLKELTEQRDAAARQSQSPDRRTSDAGHKKYNEVAGKLRKIEKDVNEWHDLVNAELKKLEDAIKDMIDKINQILACPCIAEIDKCCTLTATPCSFHLRDRVRSLQSALDNTLPDLHKANSNARLSTLSVLVTYNQPAMDVFNRARDGIKKALKNLWPMDEPSFEKLEECCKKGAEQCNIEDHVTGVTGYPIDWLIEGGGLSVRFTGLDQATGHFGDLTLINYYGVPVRVLIPAGTVLIPENNSVQRMVVTESITQIVQPGEKINIPTQGACLDSGLAAPPSGDPFGGIIFSDPFGSMEDILEILISSLTDDEAKILLDSLGLFDLVDALDTLDQVGFGYEGLAGEVLLELYQNGFSDDYFTEYMATPNLNDFIDLMYGGREYSSTGLPDEKEQETILQWLTWNINDGFDEQDGKEKIREQVEETGGSQTPEQITTLNNNIWGNIDLTKKKIGVKKADAPKTSWLEKIRKQVISVFRGMPVLESVAHAQAEPVQLNNLGFEALRAVDHYSKILALMENLTFDLEKVAVNKHSQKIAKTKESSFVKVRAELNGLKAKGLQSRPVFDGVRSFTREDLIKIRDGKKAMLVSGGDFNQLWKTVKKTLGSSYPKWESSYQKLLEKSRKSVSEGKDYTADMTRDEEKFFKVYSRIRVYYQFFEKIYG